MCVCMCSMNKTLQSLLFSEIMIKHMYNIYFIISNLFNNKKKIFQHLEWSNLFYLSRKNLILVSIASSFCFLISNLYLSAAICIHSLSRALRYAKVHTCIFRTLTLESKLTLFFIAEKNYVFQSTMTEIRFKFGQPLENWATFANTYIAFRNTCKILLVIRTKYINIGEWCSFNKTECCDRSYSETVVPKFKLIGLLD